VMPFDRAKFQF